MQAYEIFTKITMQNAASGVLAVIAKDALALEGTLGSIAKHFGSINKTSLAIGGGLSMAFGSGVILGLKSAADHATSFRRHGRGLRTSRSSAWHDQC
jgi:hypothetical protein